jgi:hypothetical protein
VEGASVQQDKNGVWIRLLIRIKRIDKFPPLCVCLLAVAVYPLLISSFILLHELSYT